MEEALAHIAKYGTKHSECIVTMRLSPMPRTFQQRVDAAAVYVNASTRFTDGFEFGFGAEIGISTQKLHARGPMALPELTSSKYLISGDGQKTWSIFKLKAACAQRRLLFLFLEITFLSYFLQKMSLKKHRISLS